MIETLQTRKEELEKRGKKGFTLMEMLIVIAIIAVLIAIAIPIFTSQLEKARESTDLANVRSAYAEQMAAWLTRDGNAAIPAINVPVTQTQANWQCDNNSATTFIAEGHAGSGVSVPAATSGNYVVSIENGVVSVTTSGSGSDSNGS